MADIAALNGRVCRYAARDPAPPVSARRSWLAKRPMLVDRAGRSPADRPDRGRGAAAAAARPQRYRPCPTPGRARRQRLRPGYRPARARPAQSTDLGRARLDRGGRHRRGGGLRLWRRHRSGGRLLRRRGRQRPDAADRRAHGVSVRLAGDRPGRGARPGPAQRADRHRRRQHLVLRPRRARGDAGRAPHGVHRGRARVRRERSAGADARGDTRASPRRCWYSSRSTSAR